VKFANRLAISALRACLAVEVPAFSGVQAHCAEATLTEDGVITLRDIPFRRGESVEVIVFPFTAAAESSTRYPLRVTPVMLLAPTEPVSDADWEGLD